jgi:signal transduction histidine kinase
MRGAVVEDAVTLARASAEAKDVAVDLDRAPVPQVWGDADQLAQLCDNLISNAVKFTPSGGRVEVRLSAGGGVLRLEVEDSGIGIPEREQSRLFERFYRTTAAAEREIPGAGLGLWIAEAVARLHGGVIDVHSRLGHGTTFTVTLPLVPVPRANPPASGTALPPGE